MDLVKLSQFLQKCSLHVITVEDWILIQRSSFDLHIDDLPYHSVQIYVKMTSRSYVVRVWGKSVKIGQIATTEDLERLCVTYFQNSAVCVGFLGSPPSNLPEQLELTQVHYPYSRWISSSCSTTYSAQGKGRLKVGLCPACSVETAKAEKVERRVPYSPENDYELDQEPVFDDAPLSEMKKFRVKKEAPRVKKESIDDFESGVKQESSKPKGPPRKHPCDKCPYVAVSLTSLYNHVKIVHDNIREHICAECGFKSGTSHGLMAHNKSVHLKIRDYICDDCGKAFATKSQLKTHKKSIHLRIKDQVCQECGYSCSEPASLRIHIKAVHRKLKDCVCEDCGAAFSRTMTLTRHKKSVHSNQRNYACKECSSTFKQADALKQHVKTVHRHIKDYVCSKCSKAFTQKKHLKRHELNIHHVQPST